MKDNYMTGLVIADIHIGAVDTKHLEKELNDVFIEKVKELGKELDFVEIAGDLFHSQINMNSDNGKLANKFILTLNDLSMENDFELRLLKGTASHDLNQLSVFERLMVTNPKFKIINTLTEDTFNSNGHTLNVLQIPEEYINDVEGYYREAFSKKYDMVFSHGTYDFAGYISSHQDGERTLKHAPTFKAKDVKKVSNGPVLSGHVHKRMDNDGVYYVGSFSRFSYGEEESKGFYMVTINTEDSTDFTLDFIENDMAETYVTVDLNDIDTDKVEDMGNYIKTLKSTYDNIRIKSNKSLDNELEIKLLKELSESDKSIKIDVKKNIQAATVDEKYQFILKGEYDLPHTIQKFIKIKYNEDVTLKDIKNILTENF